MKVRDPQHVVWRVSRRWVPWRRRGQLSETPEGLNLLDAEPDNPIGCFFLLIGIVLAVPLLIVFALALAELLLLVLLLPLAVLARIVLGRHWHVEVRRGYERVWETDAGDWSASREAIAANAELLRRGEHPIQGPLPAGS